MLIVKYTDAAKYPTNTLADSKENTDLQNIGLAFCKQQQSSSYESHQGSVQSLEGKLSSAASP